MNVTKIADWGKKKTKNKRVQRKKKKGGTKDHRVRDQVRTATGGGDGTITLYKVGEGHLRGDGNRPSS